MTDFVEITPFVESGLAPRLRVNAEGGAFTIGLPHARSMVRNLSDAIACAEEMAADLARGRKARQGQEQGHEEGLTLSRADLTLLQGVAASLGGTLHDGGLRTLPTDERVQQMRTVLESIIQGLVANALKPPTAEQRSTALRKELTDHQTARETPR